MNIKLDRSHVNMSHDNFLREDTGEMSVSYTLWVSAWEPGSPWVDTSLDEFDI